MTQWRMYEMKPIPTKVCSTKNFYANSLLYSSYSAMCIPFFFFPNFFKGIQWIEMPGLCVTNVKLTG